MSRKPGSKAPYFSPPDGSSPKPVVMEIPSRVSFSQCDIMGIVWFGNYTKFFEEGAAAMGRKCGMSYKDFYDAGLMTPIVKCHIDYMNSLRLDEVFTIRTVMHWNEAAQIDTEFSIIKEDGSLAATGYTVQLFIDFEGHHLAVSPPLLLRCRERWLKGEFYD